MSFSADVKNELAHRQDALPCCRTAELIALMRMAGTLVIGGGGNLGINFTSENAAVARKVLTLVKQEQPVATEVVVSRARRLKKNNSYLIKVLPSPSGTQLLTRLGFIRPDSFNGTDDKAAVRKLCCRRAYLRGAFLGGGSVNRPEGDYHLEMVTSNPDFANALVRMMKSFRLSARVTDRKHDYIVYMKDGDVITAFLRVIGAHNALLDFENVRVVKDMRNQVNRLVNCETANLGKTVDAAVRQVESIRLIQAGIGLAKLPPTLREAAQIRLEHPEATLQQLVEALDGRVGKSGMNHRLRKLEKIAQALQTGRKNEVLT